MNTKVIAIVGALAAVVAVGAIVTGRKGSETTEVVAPSELLVPVLDKRINDVAQIQVEDSTSSITLTRTEGIWRVVQSDNYPANFTPISQLVGQLAELKKVEAKTSNPDLYDRLEVEDPGPDAKSKVVRLSDSGGKDIASIIIGKSWYPPGGSGSVQYRYARVLGNKDSWLVSGNLNVQTTARTWMNTEIVSIPASRIQSVEVTHPDGETVTVRKSKETDPNYVLETLPPMRELTAESRPNELAGAFTSLRFDEVKPAKVAEGATTTATLVAKSFDGLVLRGEIRPEDGKTYLIVSASVDAETIDKVNAQRQADADQQNEANKDVEDHVKVEPQLVDKAKIEKEAEDLNAKVRDWAYVVPSYQSERFQRRNEFYLKAATDEEIIGGPVAPEPSAEDDGTSGAVTIDSAPVEPESSN
ncbi:DUF4340 domain-containing protein [bacterium]|nr:DUF4340 domain-containing protein [bacterium]